MFLALRGDLGRRRYADRLSHFVRPVVSAWLGIGRGRGEQCRQPACAVG